MRDDVLSIRDRGLDAVFVKKGGPDTEDQLGQGKGVTWILALTLAAVFSTLAPIFR